MIGQVLQAFEAEPRVALALELPESTSFDEWVSIGRRLCIGHKSLNWHIGDWWAFGDHRYGERANAAAEGIFGREFESLRNLGVVARAFETSRRRDTLTFTHHQEVAALPDPEADELLDRAAVNNWSTRDLRQAVVRHRPRHNHPADALSSRFVQEQPNIAQEIEAEAERIGKSVTDFLGLLLALGWAQYQRAKDG